MNYRASILGVLFSAFLVLTSGATPIIDPIANVTIPAGKSLTIPITATSSSGLPLSYTITSSNPGIAVVMHTNNPFWQLTVAQAATNTAPGAYQTPFRGGLATVTNVGTMTFMLFPEYAPHTVNIFQGLTYSGFYNSNTIFHRVISGFVIQGGDPDTNGTGGLTFQYNDEYNPQAIFSGHGQLALANSGIDTDGSQFFITIAPYRSGDFDYTIFGQMVRGFPVLTNLNSTAVDTNSRPYANEIIQTATYVTNTTDTVLTLTATNVAGLNGTITVVANDGDGGLSTLTFTASTATDTNDNEQPFFSPINMATNLVSPKNVLLTNFVNALELNGDLLIWGPEFYDYASQTNAPNSSVLYSNSFFQTLTYNVVNTNGQLQLIVGTITNYAGTASFYLPVSSNPEAGEYFYYGENPPNLDYEFFTVTFGDTPIYGQSNNPVALAGVAFTNLILATFTNGTPYAPLTTFSASVNWGDDKTNVVTVASAASGENAVLGSHTYTYPGSYPVYVQVQSSIGASATIISKINVTNPPILETNLFTTQISGQGTVSPSYTNTPLADGKSYTVTASAASQWVFLNWTDGNGFILSTHPTMTFTMYPGFSLTANFTPLLQVLTVQTVGPGTISPNYSNADLTVGANYSLTGIPKTGFGLTNWTSFINGIARTETNAATVQFTMTPNLTLQATFVDVTKPTLSITNATSGQRITNNTFTVQGVAGDNVQVATVQLQVNGGSLITAATANAFTNWSAPITLTVGTNTVSAFAVDSSGNISATNMLALDSVATNQLQIRTIGLGTLSPNYSNAWLEIGRNYSIVATPAANFVLTNWIISTNWVGGTVTNSATVQFMMASNLTLQATFAETAKPSLTITYPVSNQHLTNALPTVIGSASDVWGLASVQYQLNGGAWNTATTTNVWTNWSTTLEMKAGSNSFSAYALNLGGNFSPTNTINVLSSNAFLLELSFLTNRPYATNGLNLGLLVSTGLVGHVQYSTNLINWATLTNFTGSNSTLHLLDPAATNSADRYYRAVIP